MENEKIILESSVEIRTWHSIWVFHYNQDGLFFFTANENNILGAKKFPKPFEFQRGIWNVSPAMKIENIKGLDIMVDEIPVSSFKRAAVGSLIFGGIGAVAGALSGIKAKPKSKITIIIYFDLIELSSVSIPCKAMGDAIRLVSTISNIEDNLNKRRGDLEQYDEVNLATYKAETKESISDEILKLKKMLDDDIISDEEFKSLKKRLINNE
jgi:hypothetical protein